VEENERLRAYADKLADGLPMLPNDIALLEAGNVRMAAQLAAIDAACLAVCPENSAACVGEPDDEMGRYVLMTEDADAVIDTDDPAEVITGLCGLWSRVSDHAAAFQELDALTPLARLGLDALTAMRDGGGMDGFEIQDAAEKHGVIMATEQMAPCSEDGCVCAEYDTGLVTCYRDTPATVAARTLLAEGT
jgi:hypothetical protein